MVFGGDQHTFEVKELGTGRKGEFTYDSSKGLITSVENFSLRELERKEGDLVETDTSTSLYFKGMRRGGLEPKDNVKQLLEKEAQGALGSFGSGAHSAARGKVSSLIPFSSAEDAGEKTVHGITGLLKRLVFNKYTWIAVFLFVLLTSGVLSGVVGATPVGEYLGFGGERLAAASVGLEFDDQLDGLREVGARFGCVLKGPGCLQQWRINNTARPESREKGEQFGLRIERFQAGRGGGIDVANRPADDAIPVSFSVYNTRHGLDGYIAYDVKYRIQVRDTEIGGGGKVYCGTGWQDIRTGYNINGGEEGIHNDLYAGTSASAGYEETNLTMSKCNMLQPFFDGQYRTVTLEFKYEYSSQSTLYYKAMAESVFQSDPSLEFKWKKSVTADTPVKSMINVESPVLFSKSPPESNTFGLRSRLYTNDPNVRFRVDTESVKLKMSGIVEKAGGEDCNLERADRGRNTYRLKKGEGKISELISKRQQGKWFSDSRSVPWAGCTFKIRDEKIPELSPSGETLSADMFANYTVAIDEPISSFKLTNSRCAESEFNCPLLVPKNAGAVEGVEVDTGKKRVSSCKGTDIGPSGCDVIDVTRVEPWTNRQLLTGENSIEKVISSGETAYFLQPLLENRGKKVRIWSGNVDIYDVVGFTDYTKNRMEDEDRWLMFTTEIGGGMRVRVDRLAGDVCPEKKAVRNWANVTGRIPSKGGDQLLAFKAPLKTEGDCKMYSPEPERTNR